jgi:hypothetical protein
MLQWAREHRCPWNGGNVCLRAAQNGHLELLQWARANRCPWNKPMTDYHSGDHPETQAWVQQQPP